jgi:hypothetical protein
MSRVIIAFMGLFMILMALLLLFIIFLSVALLVFAREGKKKNQKLISSSKE